MKHHVHSLLTRMEGAEKNNMMPERPVGKEADEPRGKERDEDGLREEWSSADEWKVAEDFLRMYPLRSVMLGEFEAFLKKFLPDIVTGGTQSEVYAQHNSEENRFRFRNLRIFPPTYQDPKHGTLLDTFASAFRRKSTLCAIVTADVLHEHRIYRPPLSLKQFHAEFTNRLPSSISASAILSHDWIVLKTKVNGVGELQEGAISHKLPPSFHRWKSQEVIVIFRYVDFLSLSLSPLLLALLFLPCVVIYDVWCVPTIWYHRYPDTSRPWNQSWVVGDVFKTANKKPFPEFDDRLLIKKTMTINLQTALFDMPLMIGLFPNTLCFDDPKDRASPVAGSFCTNGLPKQIFLQLRLIPNVAFVFSGTDRYSLQCEVRSLRDTTKWHSTSTLYIQLIQQSYNIVAKVPYFVTKTGTEIEVPLQHCFIFLGVETVEEAAAFLFPSHIKMEPKLRHFLERLLQTFEPCDPQQVRESYVAKMDKPLENVISIFEYVFFHSLLLLFPLDASRLPSCSLLMPLVSPPFSVTLLPCYTGTNSSATATTALVT